MNMIYCIINLHHKNIDIRCIHLPLYTKYIWNSCHIHTRLILMLALFSNLSISVAQTNTQRWLQGNSEKKHSEVLLGRWPGWLLLQVWVVVYLTCEHKVPVVGFALCHRVISLEDRPHAIAAGRSGKTQADATEPRPLVNTGKTMVDQGQFEEDTSLPHIERRTHQTASVYNPAVAFQMRSRPFFFYSCSVA